MRQSAEGTGATPVTLSAMPRVLAFLGGVALVSALVVGAVLLVDNSRRPASDSQGPPVTEIVPGPGQSFLTGEAGHVTVEGANFPPIPTPFILTAADRGTGKATIDGALVDGRRTSIVWDGGASLTFSGDGGAIDLTGATVDLDPEATVWTIDGAARPLAPGNYRLAGTVAVGGTGLAEAREGFAFTADAGTSVSSTGRIGLRQRAGPIELDGPGSVRATGRLRVRSESSTVDSGSVQLAEAPFHLRVEPGAGALDVDGLLQGPVTTDP